MLIIDWSSDVCSSDLIRGEGEPATIGRTCSTAKLWPSRSMGKEQTRMNDPVLIAIACGLLAVLYGFITSRQVLGAPAGNEKMQEIAAAIQDGAHASLKRQYSPIAVVGVVVAIIIEATLSCVSATGFVIGALLSGVAGFLGKIGRAPV